MDIFPLDEAHDLYSKGFRFCFRIDTQLHYFKTRAAAELEKPIIERACAAGYYGCHGYDSNDYWGQPVPRRGTGLPVKSVQRVYSMLKAGSRPETLAAEIGCTVDVVRRIRRGSLYGRVRRRNEGDDVAGI